MDVKGDSSKVQKEKKRPREKASFFLGNTYIIIKNRILVKKILKTILRSQMEMRTVLLEIREKAILVIKWQRT